MERPQGKSRPPRASIRSSRTPPKALHRESAGSRLLVGRPAAFGGLLAIEFPLLLAPRGPFLRIELAVVVAVDQVEPLAIELVALLGRHRRQPVVIGLAALDARLLRSGNAGIAQLPCEPSLALPQIMRAEVAVLVECDHLARRGGLGGSLRNGRPVRPRHC